MSVLVSIVLYLVVLALIPLTFYGVLHLFLYRFRHDGLVERFSGGNPTDTIGLNERLEASGDPVVTCSHCGSVNGPEFDYCHNCLNDLS